MTEPAYKRWYKTKRWQQLRWAVLVRCRFTCGMCGAIVSNSRNLVADHKRPHRGDEALFWDDANLWAVCKPCHDGEKQRIERGSVPRVTTGVDGWPIP